MNAIITGASRGLGKDIATHFAKENYNLVLVASNSALLDQVKSDLEGTYGVEVDTFSVDLSDPQNWLETLAEISKKHNAFDVIVNNVGAFEMGGLDEVSSSQLQKLLNINFNTSYQLTQQYISSFKERKQGAIFNIGSIVTEHPRKDLAAYTISKFALKGYSKILCDELKDYGVKVTEIIPGSINTSSWDGIDAPKEEFIQTQDIINAFDLVLKSSKGSNFEEILIRPTNRNF